MIVRSALLVAVSTLALASCGQPKTEADPAKDSTAPPAVERVDPAASAPAPTAAIQTQPGSDGLQVALTRAAVTGDVLTVQLSYTKTTPGSGGQRLTIEDVNVVDDATAQRYGVLRDATGRWQASPLETPTGDHISFGLSPGENEVVWFKFPAPPATSSTVSINIPNVGPFDGVTVTR